jgi:hypothetical protein
MDPALIELNNGPRSDNALWKFRFETIEQAEVALHAVGFSIGRTQRGSPRGLLLGEYDIQKWRNLRPNEREVLHGKLWGGRLDPVEVDFPGKLPVPVAEAVWRLHHMLSPVIESAA